MVGGPGTMRCGFSLLDLDEKVETDGPEELASSNGWNRVNSTKVRSGTRQSALEAVQFFALDRVGNTKAPFRGLPSTVLEKILQHLPPLSAASAKCQPIRRIGDLGDW